MPRPARQLLPDWGPQALGTWVGVGQQSALGKGDGYLGSPDKAPWGRSAAPPLGMVWSPVTASEPCRAGAGVPLAGRGVGPRRCAGAPS